MAKPKIVDSEGTTLVKQTVIVAGDNGPMVKRAEDVTGDEYEKFMEREREREQNLDEQSAESQDSRPDDRSSGRSSRSARGK